MPTEAFPSALRIGRDPNDATWLVVRYPEDWARAQLSGLIFDREPGVLELEPYLWSGVGERWLPTEPVADGAGNWYRSDPARHLILRRPACAEAFEPLPCIGGYGWQTGRLATPVGLTIDRRGWLYVADSGNHRVQVVRPKDGSVVAVLGVTDGWGRPLAGTGVGAMTEPVHAIADPASCRVYVADRGAGLVHVFDERFEYLKSFEPRSLEPPTLPPRPPGTRPSPLALALKADGTLLILDATRPRLQHMTADGEPLPDVAIHRAGQPLPGWRAVPVRFRSFGEALLGPLDGRVHDQAWHRVLLDADIPAGTSIEIQTYASDDASESAETLPFAPADPVPGPITSRDNGETGRGRLILSDEGRWRRWRTGPYRRDRPVLGEAAGDGPSATDTISLAPPLVDRLRAGDTIAFEAAEVVESATIGQIAGREVTFTATGEARSYGAGSLFLLLDRDGRPMPGGPRQLLELGAADAIDLSQAAVDGSPNTVSFPHSVAAFLRPGDRVRLEIDTNQITLAIEARAAGSTVVTLAAPLAGDFTTGKVRLIETPGRLIAKGPFGAHPPVGEEITVRDLATSEQATILLIEPDLGADLGAVWLEPDSLGPLVSFASWSEFETREPSATDRGRYLWVRLRLFGRADQLIAAIAPSTPAIRALRAVMPRLSYLRYLPTIYSRREDREDPIGALFLERFLSLFEGRLTEFEQVYESVSRLLNAEAADPDWLRFLAGWLGLVFDPSWPIERRRALVLAGAELHAGRGTPRGLRRYIEIYTGREPLLAEGFQSRPAAPAVLGRGTLGCFQLGDAGCDLDAYAHRFSLVVFVGADDDAPATESGVRRIIESVKPAHALYSLTLVRPYDRAWTQSRVGLDMVLGGEQPPPCVLQGDTPTTDAARRPIVGEARVADARAEPQSPRGIEISQKGARIDQTLTLS